MSYFNSIKLDSLDGSISVNETQLKTTLYDKVGNPIEVHYDADGEPYIGVAMQQSIHTSTINLTTTNLAVGAEFIGLGEETFGINGLQIYHACDQDCYVYIDQSIDPSFNDSTQTLTETEYVIANVAFARTYMSVAPYFRLRVKNAGTATTTKLATYMAMTPMVNPLPPSLSHGGAPTDKGRLDTESTLRDQQVHRHVKVAPTNELYMVDRNRLVGKAFVGTNKDTNFWAETVANGGSVNINGDAELYTSTNAAGSAVYESVQKARFVAGMVNEFTGVARFGQAPAAGYTARMGAYDASDGVYFIIQDTSFGLATRYNGTDTVVWNGEFNGNLGPTISGNFEIPGRYEIMYGGTAIEYYVNGTLVHTTYAITGPATLEVDFPVRMEIENTGSTADNVIHVRGAVIFRVGKLDTSPVYRQLSGANTAVLKYGAGKLHAVINTDNAGSCQVYDGLDATGTLIADIDTAKTLGSIPFECDFSEGLYAVTANGTSVTITYE